MRALNRFKIQTQPNQTSERIDQILRRGGRNKDRGTTTDPRISSYYHYYSSKPPTTSSRSIPSFVPSDRTLEFRINSNNNNSNNSNSNSSPNSNNSNLIRSSRLKKVQHSNLNNKNSSDHQHSTSNQTNPSSSSSSSSSSTFGNFKNLSGSRSDNLDKSIRIEPYLSHGESISPSFQTTTTTTKKKLIQFKNENVNGSDRLNRIYSRREENWIIRCTEIDHRGKIVGCRSMSKSEICSQNRLQPRDLRKIDSRISNVVPSILVRDEAIIFNVLNIRALIRADSVIIFDHPGNPSVVIQDRTKDEKGKDSNDDEKGEGEVGNGSGARESKFVIRSAFLYNLLNNLKLQNEVPNLNNNNNNLNNHHNHHYENDLPYEFRALESMLSSVTTSLESELGVLKTLILNLLDGLDRNIDREKLKQLLLYSKKLSNFNSRAILVQECLDEILDNDQDMANAYLSQKLYNDNVPRNLDDHEELEQLLESSSKYVEEILHEGRSLFTNIKSTEEIIELILDSNRNNLLELDLKVSMTTMGIGSGALIAGLFGMNLKTNIEQHDLGFWLITGISLGTMITSIRFCWKNLNRFKRIGLNSSSPSNSSNSSHHNHHHHSSSSSIISKFWFK